MELPLSSQFEILENIPGHIPNRGKAAGEELNWAYRLKDISSNEIVIGMFCKPNHITLINSSTWDELQKDEYKHLSWYYSAVGYVTRTVKKEDTCPYIFLHQMIMKHVKNGKGQESVDHINQNKLDNRINNLRITTQSIQNRNRGKVSRHSNAKKLPEEINEPLPKYCVYYKEYTNKEKTKWREFFTIEGHPNQNGKRRATTKSNKVNICDKFVEAKKILEEVDREVV